MCQPLKAKNYDAIERIAGKLQQEKTVHLDGRTDLDNFMAGIRSGNKLTTNYPQDSGRKIVASQVTALHKAKPDSVFACAALINVQTKWAWWIRGDSFAGDVADARWKGTREHLKVASELVHNLPSGAFQSHLTCNAILGWGQLSGMPEADMRKLWKKFYQQFPDSIVLANTWIGFLLPQWYGDPGEWEKFATSWANRKPGEAGDIRYAQLLMTLRPSHSDHDLWGTHHFEWPRARRGLLALLKQHPHSITLGTTLLQMATDARDDETARMALVHYVKNSADSSFYLSQGQFGFLRMKLLDSQ